MADDDYKFPHELEEENQGKPEAELDIDIDAEGDVSIEIEDDTPIRDRNAKPLDKEVEDPSDEEIENYTQGAQARIKQLTHARHDERRVKEATMREKQELERLAQQLIEENKRLKQNVYTGQEAIIEGAKGKAESELKEARAKLKAAQESFDTDAIIEAQGSQHFDHNHPRLGALTFEIAAQETGVVTGIDILQVARHLNATIYRLPQPEPLQGRGDAGPRHVAAAGNLVGRRRMRHQLAAGGVPPQLLVGQPAHVGVDERGLGVAGEEAVLFFDELVPRELGLLGLVAVGAEFQLEPALVVFVHRLKEPPRVGRVDEHRDAELVHVVGCTQLVFFVGAGMAAREDHALLGQTFEQRLLPLAVFGLHLLPFEFVPTGSGIDSHESARILDVGAQGVELNYLVLGINWGHVFGFPVAVARGRQLEVDDWALSQAVDFDDKRRGVHRIQV